MTTLYHRDQYKYKDDIACSSAMPTGHSWYRREQATDEPQRRSYRSEDLPYHDKAHETFSFVHGFEYIRRQLITGVSGRTHDQAFELDRAVVYRNLTGFYCCMYRHLVDLRHDESIRYQPAIRHVSSAIV